MLCLSPSTTGAQELLGATNFKAKATLDGETTEGMAAAITIANTAPPFSVLAHGQVGECIYNDGLLEAIGYTATDSKMDNVVTMAKLFAGALFTDKPTTNEDVGWEIFGGRYKDIYVECDPPQPVVLDGEVLGQTPVHAKVRPASLKVLVPKKEIEDDTQAEKQEKSQELLNSVLETGAIDT
jgi:diacylglycerol kinase family enzyme